VCEAQLVPAYCGAGLPFSGAALSPPPPLPEKNDGGSDDGDLGGLVVVL